MKDSLHYIMDGNALYVTSCPLNDAKNWKCVELNRIYGLKDGKIMFKSEDHGNEFVFTEKHEKIIQEALKSIDKDLYEKLMEEIENNSLSF
jgi:glutamine amidotransferase